MESPKKEHSGLSPSSLNLFLGCNRRYYHKKIAKTPQDTDYREDQEALSVGKAFHKVLEIKKHILDGLKLFEVFDVVKEYFPDNPGGHTPMIFAMLDKYNVMHKKSRLRAIAVEIEIETPVFFGIVDVVLEDDYGNYWIGDMKTAAAYRHDLIPQLPGHPQLNLYAFYQVELARKLGLDPSKYMGCRYRMTTKSKIVQNSKDTIEMYIDRLRKSVKSYDFIIPKEKMSPGIIAGVHRKIGTFVNAHLSEDMYTPNYSNCLNFFRPCEFYSNCHSGRFSDLNEIDCISSEADRE